MDKSGCIIHHIERGETLSEIGKKYGIPVDKITELNGIREPDLIYYEFDLVIPDEFTSSHLSTCWSFLIRMAHDSSAHDSQQAHHNPTEKSEAEESVPLAKPLPVSQPQPALDPNPDPEKVVDEKAERVEPKIDQGFFEKVRRYGVLLSGGPMMSYSGNNQRASVGGGVNIELTVPFEAESPYVFGGELQLLWKFDYDSLDIPAGELKTMRVEFFPLLEIGFRGNGMSLLFQGGAWFSKYVLFDAEQEHDPHSKNVFDNLNLRSGVKTYLLDNRLRLGLGYLRTPWGNGAYLDLGFNMEIWGGGER